MAGFIRATHWCSFRAGKWAKIRGTAALPIKSVLLAEPEDRPCYLVEFPDGVIDFWPVHNSGYGYEFA